VNTVPALRSRARPQPRPVVRLEDFRRRRTEPARILRREELQQAPGRLELCEQLFGAATRHPFDAYFQLEHSVECEGKAS